MLGSDDMMASSAAALGPLQNTAAGIAYLEPLASQANCILTMV